MPFVYWIYIAPIIQIAQDIVQSILNQGPSYKTPEKKKNKQKKQLGQQEKSLEKPCAQKQSLSQNL